MKLPKKARVGASMYTVEELTTDMRELSGADGLCDKTLCSIHVNPNMNIMREWATMYHEINHAFVEEYNIPVPNDDEEDVVSGFTLASLCFMRDNPTYIINLIRLLRGQTNNSTT